MASEGEMVGTRSRDREIVLENDAIVTGVRDKNCRSDVNGEFPDVGPKLQLFSRCSVDNPLVGSSISESSESLSIVCYNILAECHAGGEYDSAPWIKPEQLKIEYRHQNLILELEFLNADVVCLQEVGQHYYSTTLSPAMRRFVSCICLLWC